MGFICLTFSQLLLLVGVTSTAVIDYALSELVGLERIQHPEEVEEKYLKTTYLILAGGSINRLNPN